MDRIKKRTDTVQGETEKGVQGVLKKVDGQLGTRTRYVQHSTMPEATLQVTEP